MQRSQANAAAEKAKLGGGRQQWSDIENGGDASITLTTLEKVAAALGVKAKDCCNSRWRHRATRSPGRVPNNRSRLGLVWTGD
jgi:hypothetical protein